MVPATTTRSSAAEVESGIRAGAGVALRNQLLVRAICRRKAPVGKTEMRSIWFVPFRGLAEHAHFFPCNFMFLVLNNHMLIADGIKRVETSSLCVRA